MSELNIDRINTVISDHLSITSDFFDNISYNDIDSMTRIIELSNETYDIEIVNCLHKMTYIDLLKTQLVYILADAFYLKQKK